MAESNYVHLEKEALALVFGVSRFRQYLLGSHFMLITDHKPLVGLFRPDRAIPSMAAARIQRWSLLLWDYTYKLVYRRGSENQIEDALSRLPRASTGSSSTEELPEYVLLTEQLNENFISTALLKRLSAEDVDLKQVRSWIQDGCCPLKHQVAAETLRPFLNRQNELTFAHGLVYWGCRVVIPQGARKLVLHLLHESHRAASAMKSLARTMIWYPGIDQDLERMVQQCQQCGQLAPNPPA